MKDDERIDRRRFFREGIRQIFTRVEKAAAPAAQFAKEMGKLESPPPARPVTLPLLLRPPGAIPEQEFMSLCSRCGDCVRVCPAECIVIDPTTDKSLPASAPHIIAERKPCIVCESLACMNTCPTGALQLVPRVAISMGRAIWGEGKCVRPDGVDCRKCVEICPMGTAAIDIAPDGSVEVKAGCVGCGECQYVCPTTPRAIVVAPAKT